MNAPTCFFLAPVGLKGTEISRRSDLLLLYVVVPAAEEMGYGVARVDPDAPSASYITADTLRLLLAADVVVADISGQNPNVLYELGVRHASGKPVILLAAHGERIPFDIASVRVFMYDLQDLDSMEVARRSLALALRSGETDAPALSPVSQAIDLQSLKDISQQDLASGNLTSIMSILTSIDSRISVLEERLRSNEVEEQTSGQQYSRRIFIVHGHDGELKNELARLLEKLDFRPIILHEQPDRGQTIFSKLRGEIPILASRLFCLLPMMWDQLRRRCLT